MLTPAISFEINIPREGIKEEYLILDTEENYERVLAHKYTRRIKMVNVERFNSVMRMPAEFINPVIFYSIVATVAEFELVG